MFSLEASNQLFVRKQCKRSGFKSGHGEWPGWVGFLTVPLLPLSVDSGSSVRIIHSLDYEYLQGSGKPTHPNTVRGSFFSTLHSNATPEASRLPCMRAAWSPAWGVQWDAKDSPTQLNSRAMVSLPHQCLQLCESGALPLCPNQGTPKRGVGMVVWCHLITYITCWETARAICCHLITYILHIEWLSVSHIKAEILS